MTRHPMCRQTTQSLAMRRQQHGPDLAKGTLEACGCARTDADCLAQESQGAATVQGTQNAAHSILELGVVVGAA